MHLRVTSVLRAGTAGVLALWFASVALAGDRIERMSLTAHRPLWDAILSLQQKFGWLITYEDPPYSFPGELVDMTRSYSRNPGESYKRGYPNLVAIERTVLFEYLVDDVTGDPKESVEAVLERAIHSYKDVSGDTFKVKREGNRFHVVPELVKNKDGQPERHVSVLDAAISFPTLERDGIATLKAICAAVTTATSVEVRTFAYPRNQFRHAHLTVGASHQAAREVLDSVLNRIDPRLSWQLLYAPGVRRYYLSVHSVAERTDAKPRGPKPPGTPNSPARPAQPSQPVKPAGRK